MGWTIRTHPDCLWEMFTECITYTLSRRKGLRVSGIHTLNYCIYKGNIEQLHCKRYYWVQWSTQFNNRNVVLNLKCGITRKLTIKKYWIKFWYKKLNHTLNRITLIIKNILNVMCSEFNHHSNKSRVPPM